MLVDLRVAHRGRCGELGRRLLTTAGYVLAK